MRNNIETQKVDISTFKKQISTPNLFLNKRWNSQENCDLCDIIFHDQGRFTLIPSTVFNLDQQGLDAREIINLDSVVGKPIIELSNKELEKLNDMESKYGISFNGEHKASYALGEISNEEMLNKPIDHIYYSKQGEVWFGVSLIHSEAGRKFQLKLH